MNTEPALTVAEIVDRLAATRDPNRTPYIPPTPTREDHDMQDAEDRADARRHDWTPEPLDAWGRDEDFWQPRGWESSPW